MPALWPGQTIVCIATGPSLTQEDVDYVRDKARVIVVNNAHELAPWADVMYGCDSKFWNWCHGAPTFTGAKYAMDARVKTYQDITVLDNTGDGGIETAPTGLRTGRNSGYQAINLAVHCGAKRIVLLGYDMKAGPDGRSHYFGEHPNGVRPPFRLFLEHFPTIVQPLAKLNVEVINASRSTALKCFKRMALAEALA